jgi:hypothetical protein
MLFLENSNNKFS